MQTKMTLEEIEEFLRSAGNTIFYVRFIRRTTTAVANAGDERKMRCRLHVKKGLKGGEWANGKAGSPMDHNLFPVWDMDKNGRSCVPLDGIIEMKVCGEHVVLS